MLLERLQLRKGGKAKSTVNKAGNYTKPGLRKRIFQRIKALLHTVLQPVNGLLVKHKP